jgi:hypothetical protein
MVLCLCTTECSICMQRKCITTQCHWPPCTYRLCQRCHFLYGRSKPCPACRRTNAFKRTQLERACLSLQRYMIPCQTELYYAFYYSTTYCFLPIIIVHLMATCGAVVLLVFFPNSCCQTYGNFMLHGLMMFAVIGCLMCVCVDRDDS